MKTHAEFLVELKSFCDSYEQDAKTEMLLAGDSKQYSDMQYYLGRKHAAHDIMREVYRLRAKFEAQTKCLQVCYRHMRENCKMCGFETIECPDCNEAKAQLRGDKVDRDE
jgi:hypothetical protein